jgi:DNA end-binding protein Ku
LRAADEVRAPQFSKVDDTIDPEMLAIARTIIDRRTGSFDASKFRDRYQKALRRLIEAKMKGLPIKPQEVSAPAPVIDLMAALKSKGEPKMRNMICLALIVPAAGAVLAACAQTPPPV